jgi:outer membrane biosynthesis protein TonB
MAVSAERNALRRLSLALAGACLAAGLAGCSETVTRATEPAPTARTNLVDPGQPIVLNNQSPPAAGPPPAAAAAPTTTTTTSAAGAGAPAAEPGPTAPDTQTAATDPTVAEPRPRPDPGAPGEKPAVAATAMVEPSAADIAGPQPAPEAVTTLSDEPEPLPDPGAAPTERLSDAPVPPANRDINQNEKAKLIGQLKALANRQGAGGTADAAPAADAGTNADAAARAVLCDPAVDPECAASE